MTQANTLRTIQCIECGFPRATKRWNTKYCVVCALLRDLKYWGIDKHRDCLVCLSEFSPYARDSRYCGRCDTVPKKHEVAGKCSYCENEDVSLWHETVRICKPCLLDPANRRNVLRSLGNKQSSQRQSILEASKQAEGVAV